MQEEAHHEECLRMLNLWKSKLEASEAKMLTLQENIESSHTANAKKQIVKSSCSASEETSSLPPTKHKYSRRGKRKNTRHAEAPAAKKRRQDPPIPDLPEDDEPLVPVPINSLAMVPFSYISTPEPTPISSIPEKPSQDSLESISILLQTQEVLGLGKTSPSKAKGEEAKALEHEQEVEVGVAREAREVQEETPQQKGEEEQEKQKEVEEEEDDSFKLSSNTEEYLSQVEKNYAGILKVAREAGKVWSITS